MSLLQTYRNLPAKARLGVGLGIIAWGTIGLYISDRAEKKLGFEPTPAEQEAWAATLPKITTIERNDGKS